MAVYALGDRESDIHPNAYVHPEAVIHCTPVDPTVIGAGCVIGHNAHVEGARVPEGHVDMIVAMYEANAAHYWTDPRRIDR